MSGSGVAQDKRSGTNADVLVIGAGQAGLAAAYHLSRLGLRHLVVDAETGPGGAWRHRWPTLTMATVNGIRELPDLPVPPVDPGLPAAVAVPAYFADYERLFGLRIHRPVKIRRVATDDAGCGAGPGSNGLIATSSGGIRFAARALINATGTWTQPYWPAYPGRANFLGHQWHTHDYPGPGRFDGARTVVIGGGISALQLLLEIATRTATLTWVTRTPPRWRRIPFDEKAGRRAVAMVTERVSRGLPPSSVVSVTGLPVTPQVRAALADGTLRRQEMFSRILPGGVQWPDGRTVEADILLWCTGFRPALGHLAPLRLREPGGGIAMVGTRVARDPRIHLIGYGPSASTVGANRAGRAAAAELRGLLQPK